VLRVPEERTGDSGGVTRRRLLKTGGGLALGVALGPGLLPGGEAFASGLRHPDTLPDPSRPAGEPTDELPFDHIVFVMMENHSFDNHLGMLSARGQPLADGLTIGPRGLPTNSNPYQSGAVTIARNQSLCQPGNAGSQDWHDTHQQINGGRMDGFAATGVGSMIYWDQPDLPFYYSLANTFCLANRWFCSAPCQTYPNGRFLMAGTAFGLISTTVSSVTAYPPNGTIFDRLSTHGISWANYFVDVPTSAIIADTVIKYPLNMRPIAEFYLDCAAGTLPAVSMIDSEVGVIDEVPSPSGLIKVPFYPPVHDLLQSLNQDEENPADISLGENFVAGVVDAVLKSPSWPRILLVWLFDEHGGYYDHVPPPAAIAPDSIQPVLGAGDQPGGYNIYGPRVPAVVVSGYARPHAVTNVVHDHTSILATIEAKWNLPAMTYRDANAATLADFLQASPAFPEPPTLAAPSNTAKSEADCTTDDPPFPIHPDTTQVHPRPRRSRAKLTVRFYGRRARREAYLVALTLSSGTLSDIEVELRDGTRALARGRAEKVSERTVHVTLTPVVKHERVKAGRYDLRVLDGGKTLYSGRVKVAAAAF
jgi:phospholipase C